MKDLGVYNKCGGHYDEIFGTGDIIEVIKEGLDNPDKVMKFVKNLKTNEMQGIASYATQFADELNKLPMKERPFAMIGIETALKALYKTTKENFPMIYDEIKDLREISKNCLITIGTVDKKTKDE